VDVSFSDTPLHLAHWKQTILMKHREMCWLTWLRKIADDFGATIGSPRSNKIAENVLPVDAYFPSKRAIATHIMTQGSVELMEA